MVKRPKPRQNTWTSWLALPVIFLLGLGAGWLVWGQDSPAAAPDTQVTVDKDVKRYQVPTDGDPSQGPENAPVTIVEFSDYQCPFCTRWYDEVYSRLMKDYQGKIRFVYRDFPLYSIHPEAEPAAEAANCAGEQGAYWQFHDALFGQKNGLNAQAYSQYASEIGLDLEKFNTCLSEHRYKDEVTADFKYASKMGVSSTPTFFVNGLAVVGAQPYEVFQQLIDKELAGEIPK
jgi:protein-disulfide isomerase